MVAPDAPGIIVAAEEPLFRLLTHSGVDWDTQRPVPSMQALWQDLSNGELDPNSAALVFSDSLHAGLPSAAAEREATAQAVFTMAHHGAPVFVACWDEANAAQFVDLVAAHAQQLDQDPASVTWHWLPVTAGGLAVMETLRRVLGPRFRWPGQYPAVVNEPLSRVEQSVAQFASPAPVTADIPTPDAPAPVDEDPFTSPAVQQMRAAAEAPAPASDAPVDAPAPVAAPQPLPEPPAPQTIDPTPPMAQDPAVHSPLSGGTLPAPTPQPTPVPAPEPVTAEATVPEPPAQAQVDETPTVEPVTEDVPGPAAAASAPAAQRHIDPDTGKLPGQLTISVVSSKGGSGKSTTAMMLAGQIAHSSHAAGKPLSVALVDLDVKDAQVGTMIGQVMPTALNIRVQDEWSDTVVKTHMVRANDLGVDCLLAPVRPRSADVVGPEFYRVIIRSLQRQYDVVILDCSVDYLSPLLSTVAFPESDEILVTTTLINTAIGGLARMIREMTTPADHGGMGLPREKIGIVVSQNTADVGVGREEVLAAGMGVPVIGVIPLATVDVMSATNANQMFKLLYHPALGPAYHRLASTCLPGRDLPPLLDSNTGMRIKYTPPPKEPARVDPMPASVQTGPQNLNDVTPAAPSQSSRPVAPAPKKRIWNRS